ncbi:MAG: MFS transporter [Anaerolineales bacterium]|nr:MFS transporter [Anaerolineae bacterium]PWB77839.1 MAG: MFS transporter [Anaerolineales bacterium]
MIRIPPSLKHRRFFYLWLGLLISIAGTQMQIWAIFWHIRTLTEQPIALGGVGLARILPVIVFSLIGGAVADSLNRTRILFITQSAAALLALALGLLTQFGHITIWHIYALTALQAVAIAFDGPARQALVPNLVSAKDLPNAFSMTSIAFQTGAILGPALTGFAIAFAGQEMVYYINAISYGAVILALILIGDVPQKRSQNVKVVSWTSIREGIQFILNKPIILSTMLLDFVATFFASANTLMPIVARDVLKVGVVEYGWLSAAQSFGAVLAALVVSQIAELRRQGQVFLGSVVVFGAATVLFGLSSSVVLAWCALAVTGAADSVSTIIRNTIRQLQTPDHIRGRMTSVNQIFFQGGPQLGEVEAGIVAQLLGAPFAIVSGGIACVLGMTLIVRKWPALLTYNGDEPTLAGAPAD